MIVPRENFEVATEEAAARREWVKPGVQRLSAGSAETGSTVTTDIGVAFS